MKLVRYRDGGVYVADEPAPALPPGGLLIRTEACGLCSGELMAWYMDAKSNPVLGHEVAGKVIESDDDRFPVGCRVFPHHHAPCGHCSACVRGAYVQCETWRKTKLDPGGMAEFFAVSKENLADTHVVNDLKAIDAALVEPLACVVKSLRQGRWEPAKRAAVIGLGNMGLLHMLALGKRAIGYELESNRREYAASLGMRVGGPKEITEVDVVFVCPGAVKALEFAQQLVVPRGTIVLFAPFGNVSLPNGLLDRAYFKDVTLATSYSAGPDDTLEAIRILRAGPVKAEMIVSDFISIDELPAKYELMKAGSILKAMVVFDQMP